MINSELNEYQTFQIPNLNGGKRTKIWNLQLKLQNPKFKHQKEFYEVRIKFSISELQNLSAD